jgi:uncharacterized protein HemY
MRATIAWSEDLLAREVRVLFRRLAVFIGGCTLEAVEAVCLSPEGTERLQLDLLEGLEALLDQSLIRQGEEEGDPRFSMLHVIREYVLERLDESEEAEVLHRAHANYYLSLAERAELELRGSEQSIWVGRLECEHDNLRTALDWMLEHGAAEAAAQLCSALGYFWVRCGHWNEGRRWLGGALNASEETPLSLRAHLMKWTGYIVRMQGEYAAASEVLEESLVLFRELGDRAGVADVLAELGQCAVAQEQFERAALQFEESLGLLQATGNRAGVLYVLEAQVQLAEDRGDYTRAGKLLEQARALAQSLGDTHFVAMCDMEFGQQALLRGDGAAAEVLLHEALLVQQHLNDTNCSARSLSYLGMLALERGDPTKAQELLEQSLARFEALAKQPSISSSLMCLGAAQFTAGDIHSAEDAYLKSLRIEQGRMERRLVNRRRIAACLESLAEVALARGKPERAAGLLGTAAQALASVGAAPLPLPPRLRTERERVAARAQMILGEAAWEDAFAAGKALLLDEALADVLAQGS